MKMITFGEIEIKIERDFSLKVFMNTWDVNVSNTVFSESSKMKKDLNV